MNNVFIYAQGEGSRWGEGSHLELPSVKKQLLPIGKELLVQRTVRQFNQHHVIIFGKCKAFGDLFSCDTDIWELKEPAGSIIDGFLTTAPYWKKPGSSILILGDVIFENKVAQDISNFSGENVTIFGRMSSNDFTSKKAKEIFAVALPDNEETKQRFFGVMVNFINQCGKERSSKKLWDLWFYIVEKGLTEYIFRDYSGRSYTDDVDSTEEYFAFGKTMIQLALEDDKNFVLA